MQTVNGLKDCIDVESMSSTFSLSEMSENDFHTSNQHLALFSQCLYHEPVIAPITPNLH